MYIYHLELSSVSIRHIAKAINRSSSTVSKKLKRNNCDFRYKYLPILHKKYIDSKLNQQWFFEQIANRKLNDNLDLDIPSHSTIYRWIHRKFLIDGDMKKFRRKGKFKRPTETRCKFNIG